MPRRWESRSATVALRSPPPGSLSDGAHFATGSSSDSLPCSARPATIVAARPFETDAQRNTVEAFTGSPLWATVSP